MTKASRSGRLERIEWQDAAGYQGWTYAKKSYRAIPCVSVGWIVYEDKHVVTLTDAIQLGHSQIGNITTIPKGMITKRKVLNSGT